MIFRFGDLILDTEAWLLTRKGRTVHVSPKALDLLALLVEQRPRAVTKQEIHDRIWPATWVVDANLPVLIREIRNAIGDVKHEIIRTLHGRGYAFAGAVLEDHPVSSVQPDTTSGQCLLLGERVFPLVSGVNIVGRDTAVQVTLPWTSVSRHHASIRIEGESATLADLGSKNGTFVAGSPVSEPVRLADGVELRFGKVIVIYRSGAWSGETASVRDSSERGN